MHCAAVGCWGSLVCSGAIAGRHELRTAWHSKEKTSVTNGLGRLVERKIPAVPTNCHVERRIPVPMRTKQGRRSRAQRPVRRERKPQRGFGARRAAAGASVHRSRAVKAATNAIAQTQLRRISTPYLPLRGPVATPRVEPRPSLERLFLDKFRAVARDDHRRATSMFLINQCVGAILPDAWPRWVRWAVRNRPLAIERLCRWSGAY